MATVTSGSSTLKRKSRSPSCNNAFASPRPKKQRTESPILVTQSDTEHLTSEMHEHSNTVNTARVQRPIRSQQNQNSTLNQHNVSFCYLYDEHGVIPKLHLNRAKRIEIRIPISALSPRRNAQISRRLVWGGGAVNDHCYSADSDVVSILYHSGMLSPYPMDCGHDRSLDPFAIFNQILAQNSNRTDDGFPEFFIRTSSHKLSAEEMEYEQQRGRDGRDMIGIAAILEVLPSLQRYEAVALNGMYSRKWIGGDEVSKSLRLSHIVPLSEYGQFVVDGVCVFPMEMNRENNMESNSMSRDSMHSLMMKTDKIGMTFNSENRPCLQYNIAVVGNANLLMNRVDFAREQRTRMERHRQRSRGRRRMDGMHSDHCDSRHSMFGEHDDEFDGDYKMERNCNNDEEKRYGHLLQWRLQRFNLMMESGKSEQYQLVQSGKMQHKSYAVIWMNPRKQKLAQKIAEDLKWEHLKWSKKGLMVKDTLYCVDKVWLERR